MSVRKKTLCGVFNGEAKSAEAVMEKNFLEYLFFGSRQMRDYLNSNLGYCVGRKRVRRLMHHMGLSPVYQESRTTVPHPEHKKYPYYWYSRKSQFTSAVFTGLLQANGLQISMDGRGRCLANVFIERLWRSLKCEDY